MLYEVITLFFDDLSPALQGDALTGTGADHDTFDDRRLNALVGLPTDNEFGAEAAGFVIFPNINMVRSQWRQGRRFGPIVLEQFAVVVEIVDGQDAQPMAKVGISEAEHGRQIERQGLVAAEDMGIDRDIDGLSQGKSGWGFGRSSYNFV